MVINHRNTRTGFANARPDWEWRKRKRRASALVCGFTINGVPCAGCYTRRCTVSVRPDVFLSDAARCRVSMGSGASVLVCGLERGAGAHEFRKIAVDDAVALLDGIVAREDVRQSAGPGPEADFVFAALSPSVARQHVCREWSKGRLCP